MKTILIILCLFLIFPSLSHAEVKLYDTFETAVSRTYGGAGTGADLFSQAYGGQWPGGKWVNNSVQSGAAYAYTVDRDAFATATGNSAVFPGTHPNGRVACFEFLPDTFGYQTDAYFTVAQGVAGTVPSNSWFQFWIYPNHYGSQLGYYSTFKFLYPCHNTEVGTCLDTDLDWLVVGADWTNWPYEVVDPDHLEDEYQSYSPNMTFNITPSNGSANHQMGETLTSPYPGCMANTWTLVKINLNMSNAASGIFRMWKREYGEAEFTLISEYVGGSTPGGFTWTPEFSGGMSWMKLWTTCGDPGKTLYDMWTYMDDFYWATSEGDLPIYGTDSFPTKVQGLSILGGSLR